MKSKILTSFFLISLLPLCFASTYPIHSLKLDHLFLIYEEYSSKSLQVTTFNTWGLPINLPKYNQKSRFQVMPNSLLYLNTDIIGLQETFHEAIRKKLYNQFLANGYFSSSDCNCNRKYIIGVKLDCFGGLMTFSKYPVQNERFYPFPQLKGASMIEKVGQKGFLVTNIKKGNDLIRVINTHLYAGNTIKAENFRLEQIKYLDSILQVLNNDNIKQTIFLGDFNIHLPEAEYSIVYDFIVDSMGFKDTSPIINEKDLTMNNQRNFYVSKKEPITKLDYIFIKQLSEIYEAHCVFDEETPISDHFGFQVRFLLD